MPPISSNRSPAVIRTGPKAREVQLAKKEFGDSFVNALKQDLGAIGYAVSDIGAFPPVSLRIIGGPGEAVSLSVQETGLPGYTDQHGMSQGMYRTVALLTHLNYYLLKRSATCILVDDIGEGLDFERSCKLIDLLRSKTSAADIQLILSTNDRFTMNRVPLEEWSVIQRDGNHVRVRNYSNSRNIFEEFKFTGMSNFSFLETDFINEQTSTIH